MYYEWYQKNRRTIIVGVIGFVLLLICWAIYDQVSHIGKIAVTITTVPRDATITINDRSTRSGTHWLVPGTYTIGASKDGFVSRKKQVDVTPDKKQNVVSLALSPQSESAKAWAAAHADDYSNNGPYGAIEAQANGEYFAKQNPIVTALPYKDPYYKIDYEQGSGNSVTLTVTTSSPRYRYFAVKTIRDLGYNPTDYKIIFKNFQNPLGASRAQ